MTGGSLQLRVYRQNRRTMSCADAAQAAGIAIGEAQLIDRDDARDPPPPEAFEPIPATAGTAVTTTQEPDMARAKRQTGTVNGEVPKPDFEMAVKIFREDIKPAQARVGEYAQEQSTAYKAIKKQANIQPAAAKLAFRLDGMEESKRDDFLRCFNGLLKALNIFMPSDLVDAAEGKASGGDVVPIAERKAPKLATVPSDDSDLAGGETEPLFVVHLASLNEWLLPNGDDWTADRQAAGTWDRDRADAIAAEFDNADDIAVVDNNASVGGSMIAQAAE